jgi:uncharacterized protein YjgD (DUF1641 family)
MRKYDIFGKRISQVKFIYLLVIVFLLGIAGYFGVINIQENRLYELEQEEKKIQRQIDTILAIDEPISYETIDELLPYLPQSFDQYVINNELTAILNETSFTNVIDYNVTYMIDTSSPFTEPLPDTLQYVRIAINLSVSEPEKLLDYIDYLVDAERIYYIQTFSVSYATEGALATLVLFTFYNDIN